MANIRISLWSTKWEKLNDLFHLSKKTHQAVLEPKHYCSVVHIFRHHCTGECLLKLDIWKLNNNFLLKAVSLELYIITVQVFHLQNKLVINIIPIIVLKKSSFRINFKELLCFFRYLVFLVLANKKTYCMVFKKD